MDKMNLTMLTDFYEITMANGYLENNMAGKIAYFDMFFRKVPDDGGFAIMAGVEQLIEYLKNLKFDQNDLDYLRSKQLFSEEFIQYLSNFEFNCDVWAIPEGTPIFPNEPVVIVRGPVMIAQFVETMVLITINHQSLILLKPIGLFGRLRGGGSWNLAHAGRKAMTELFPVLGRHI
jgi:nicotinate phosphoribosyltransferase